MPRKKERIRAAGLLSVALAATALFPAGAAGQATLFESEPNDTPATANPIAGEVRVAGVRTGVDQDGYMWTVSDEDARKRWTFELEGIPDALTIMQVFSVEFAENGTDVVSKRKLFGIGTRGVRPAVAENVLFEPGDYVLGVAFGGGGGGTYRPPVASVNFGDEGEAEETEQQQPEPGGYRLTVREGNAITLESSPPPRGTAEEAFKLRLRSEYGAYLETEDTWYRLEIAEKDASQRWDVTAQAPVGRELKGSLLDGGGNELTDAITDAQGKLVFPDLSLDPGTYTIELASETAGYIRAVGVAAVGERIQGAEAEPNDNWATANRADLSAPVTGRMGKRGEYDFFSFELDEATADEVLTLSLQTGEGQRFRFCLLDDAGGTLQCRDGTGSIELKDLVLQPGSYGFTAQRGPEAAEYSVTLSGEGPYRTDQEAEPNDKVGLATAVPSKNRIKGRFVGKENDFYKFLIADEPQLWRFQVIGDSVYKVVFYDGAGIENQSISTSGERRIRLENVFLMPGTHYLGVYGRGDGDYTVLARPLGPPDLNGEMEPNDDPTRMQLLRMGQTRTGLLSEAKDQDQYRFTLADWDRIRLTVEPPPDGKVQAALYWGGVFKQSNVNFTDTGQPLILEGLFPPGQYRLNLSPAQPSDAEYQLTLERLERFGCPIDCEPNDDPDFASPLPPGHVIEGTVNDWRDPDYYELPVFGEATNITISSEERRNVSLVKKKGGTNHVDWDAEANAWRGVIPANTQVYLEVGSWNEPQYRLKIEIDGYPPAEPAGEDSPLFVSMELPDDRVGAYRRYGQRLDGRLLIANTSPEPAEVHLDVTTSDHRWRTKPAVDRITVPGGVTEAVPLEVFAPADAWADWPVRVSAQGVAADGRKNEAWVEVNADRELEAMNPVFSSTLPEELRGGFNVAWQALGGEWIAPEDAYSKDTVPGVGSGFKELTDGLAVRNNGVSLKGSLEPITREIDYELAGDEAIDIAGFALSQLGPHGLQQYLSDFEVALSVDGMTFTTVLDDVLAPINSEQAFVLPEPVPARYARLRLERAYDGGVHAYGLGEFKVIAKPGLDLSDGQGFNIADPALGGHVVWSLPAISAGYENNLLIEDDRNFDKRLNAGQSLEWVVGFNHDRAAQITGLRWVHMDEVRETYRFDKVSVSISMDSPVGPWKPVGNWEVSHDGEPAELRLDGPTWARFVRFAIDAPAKRRTFALADAIEIRERPTGDEYVSVLTEWGYGSQEAVYEVLRGIEPPPPVRAAENTSKPTAAPLRPDERAGGHVRLGKTTHWYQLELPPEHNTVTIDLGGDPTVRTILNAETGTGEPVLLRGIDSETLPYRHRFEAAVNPSSTVYLEVEEPPRNVAFLWDTSASVGAYLPIIYSSLITYAADLVPGRDAANLIPFGGQTLLGDWYGEPYVLQTVLNEYQRNESSSEAERTMHTASLALAPRPGTKAIVMVTDAATNRYANVWEQFHEVQPRIFGLGLSSSGAFERNPEREQDLMQDWSRVNGGHYSHLLSEGEMEVAFDRVATMLRRPAGYTLDISTRFEEAPGPGTLRVVSGKDGGDGTGIGGGAVELILDASGSMLQRMEGKRRIVIAKEVLTEAVNEYIPEGTPVAFRVFGHKEPNACRTDLEIPMKPLDPASATQVIQDINAKNLARTPIADSLAKVESDLGQAEGRRVVVLVTDGEETCDGDPEKVIQALADKGFDISLNIVGFAIEDAELEAQFENWAELGGGRYFSARDEAGLSEAVEQALQVQYQVYDASDTLVATSRVGAEPVALAQGIYRVIVDTSPQPRTYDNVEIAGGEATIVDIASRD